MAKNNKMPVIRFSGYTNVWEQRKLSEVVTINPKTELPDEFKYVDLESVVGTNLLGFQVIKKENAPSRAQRLASYGDVFYQTVRPYQRNNYLFENIDKDMVFSTGYAQLRSKLDSYFLLTLVQNDNFVKVVLDNCTGTSYPAINGSELGKITVQIPSSEVEANQIGKVFRGIDKSITLHQRKLEKLKLTKKALLQKLFPQNGSKLPELRFKGFTDAWEQYKLSDITEVIMGQSPSSKNYTDNPNDDILVQGNADLKDGKVVPRLWTKEITKTIDKGGIILTVRAPVGDVAKTDYKVVLGRGVAGIKGNDYIYQFLQKLQYNRYWVSLSSGSTFESINSNDIKDLIIDIPSIEEQTKISMLLNNVNSIITLHHRKLEMLKNVKKGLLQKMFV